MQNLATSLKSCLPPEERFHDIPISSVLQCIAGFVGTFPEPAFSLLAAVRSVLARLLLVVEFEPMGVAADG